MKTLQAPVIVRASALGTTRATRVCRHPVTAAVAVSLWFCFVMQEDACGVNIPISSGLKAHFDATDTSSLTLAGGLVDAWSGSSGTTFSAQAPTADHRPLLVPDAINGRDALFFDGTQDSNALDDVLRIDGLGLGNQMTAFFVIQNAPQDTNGGSCCRPFFIGGDNGIGPNTFGYGFGFKRPGANPEEIRVDFPASADTSESFDMLGSSLVGGVGDGMFQIFSAVIDRNLSGDDIEIFQNGLSLGSRNVNFDAEDGNGDPLLETYYIGGVNELTGSVARKFTGQLAEIIIFDRALDSDEHALIGSFLEFKFNLDTAFPNNNFIPEPASPALFLAALVCTAGRARRRRECRGPSQK